MKNLPLVQSVFEVQGVTLVRKKTSLTVATVLNRRFAMRVTAENNAVDVFKKNTVHAVKKKIFANRVMNATSFLRNVHLTVNLCSLYQ